MRHRHFQWLSLLLITTILGSSPVAQSQFPHPLVNPDRQGLLLEAGRGLFERIPTGMKVYANPMEFSSCQDFKNYLNYNQMSGIVGGQHYQAVGWDGRSYQNQQLANGQWQASVRISFETRWTGSTMNILMPQWSQMTTNDTDALKVSLRNLIVHEIGHIYIAEFVAHNSDERIYAPPAPSKKEAEENLKTVLTGQDARMRKQRQEIYDNAVNRLDATVKKEQSDYDKITNHGNEQSKGPSKNYPGGNNVVFNCSCPSWGCPSPNRNVPLGCPSWGCR